MPKLLTMKLFPSPPVGFPVIRYPQAQESSGKGTAAIVTASAAEGRISLITFPKGAGPRTYYDVRHCIDPLHKRRTETTMRSGGWGFLPGFDQTLYRPEIVDLEKHLSLSIREGESLKEDQFRETVLSWFSQGFDVGHIAGRMQVPKEDVQSVVDEILDARHNVSVKPKTIEELVEEAVAKAMAKYTEQPTPQRGRGKKTASVPPQTEQATS